MHILRGKLSTSLSYTSKYTVKRAILSPVKALFEPSRTLVTSKKGKNGTSMSMQNILARKAVGMTALREPKKVIADAGDEPVAILNRNEVVGYFVPASAVSKIEYSLISDEKLNAILERRKDATSAGVAYLKNR